MAILNYFKEIIDKYMDKYSRTPKLFQFSLILTTALCKQNKFNTNNENIVFLITAKIKCGDLSNILQKKNKKENLKHEQMRDKECKQAIFIQSKRQASL